jgi:hypothetical protein
MYGLDAAGMGQEPVWVPLYVVLIKSPVSRDEMSRSSIDGYQRHKLHGVISQKTIIFIFTVRRLRI